MATGLFSINLNVDELVKLELIGPALERVLTETVIELAVDAVAIIESHMVFTKGYETGELRGSLGVLPEGRFAAHVGPHTDHDAFVEFGTGQRGAQSDVVPMSGYIYGSKPGMEAEPYMTPSVPDVQERGRLILNAKTVLAVEGATHA